MPHLVVGAGAFEPYFMTFEVDEVNFIVFAVTRQVRFFAVFRQVMVYAVGRGLLCGEDL